MFAGTKPPLRCLNLEPLSCIFLTVKSFGKIAVCLAGGLALTAGLRADDLALNSSPTPDNPYGPIVARNVFGLNPPVPETPNTPADFLKITPSGIQNFFGQAQVLFKVSGGKKDEFYTLAEGQRQDDIEVVRIDDKDGIITFNNHGVVQNIPLVSTATGSGGSPSPMPADNANGFDNGGNGNNSGGGQGFTRFGRRGGRNNGGGGNNGGNNGASNGNDDSTLRTVPTRTYQPPASNLTPEEQAIQIEQNRAAALDNNDPTANLFPPTPLTGKY